MHVREEIARGGFGLVELVETDDGTLVARKTFQPSVGGLSDDELTKMRKRFVREVNIQRSLNSSAFVPVLEFDLDGEAPWFTMPVAERNFSEEITDARGAGTSLENALNSPTCSGIEKEEPSDV